VVPRKRGIGGARPANPVAGDRDSSWMRPPALRRPLPEPVSRRHRANAGDGVFRLTVRVTLLFPRSSLQSR
jgi:hypothetical protein